MVRPEKIEKVKEIAASLKNADVTLLADYRGLTSNEITELRRGLREAGIDFKIFKNTLSKIAAEECDLTNLNEVLNGPTAFAFGFDEPEKVAKILSDFSKEHKALEIKGAVFENTVHDVSIVKKLASLPSREMLIQKLAIVLNSPIQGLVNVLSAPARDLASVLSQVKDQRVKEQGQKTEAEKDEDKEAKPEDVKKTEMKTEPEAGQVKEEGTKKDVAGKTGEKPETEAKQKVETKDEKTTDDKEEKAEATAEKKPEAKVEEVEAKTEKKPEAKVEEQEEEKNKSEDQENASNESKDKG